MTKAEWLTATDPIPMLEFLGGKASERRLRLFACACVRRLFHLLSERRERYAVEVAELYSDGLASSDDFRRASFAGNPYGLLLDPGAAVACFDPFDAKAAVLAADVYSRRGGRNGGELLRDIFNPFRPVAADPSWHSSMVEALTRRMYETGDFSTMPILADALQDAGCDNGDILNHCQGPGPHVRGCWVVDLLLGKE